MANQEQQSNNTPFIIIGLVLLAAIAGGWWFYSSSQAEPTNANSGTVKTTPAPANNQSTSGEKPLTAQEIYEKAPAGAQPAHTLGSQNATVTIEEFADFQCPTCATVHTFMKQINEKYGDRVKIVFRNFPLAQIHPNANNAAAAAESAGRQGKFWDMQDRIFVNQNEWKGSPDPLGIFEKYAASIGLDVEKFKSEYGSMSVRSRVENDVARGRYLRVDSTPTIFINGNKVPSQQFSVAGISTIIDGELKKADSKPETKDSNSQTTDEKKAESKEETKEAKTEPEK